MTLRLFARRFAGSPGVGAMLGNGLSLVGFKGVAVLCYHAVPRDGCDDMPFGGLHVPAPLFAEHCRVLSRYCTPISLSTWRKHHAEGAALPPRSVLVTFDDGYRSVYTQALPILKHFGVPATVFICSDPVERGEMFWYDAVARATNEQTVAALKTVPYRAWADSVAAHRTKADDTCSPMNRAEVEALASESLIEIGGHSHSHPILRNAPADVQQQEIEFNLARLEQWTGRRARAFAYPNGRPDVDFDETTSRLLAAAGIEDAFTTEERMAPADGARLLHPRFVMTRGLSAERLLYQLGWVWR
jgi:peptidoglycan/xylan/chitin deacetylase (PgdA/CDA1 family)